MTSQFTDNTFHKQK